MVAIAVLGAYVAVLASTVRIVASGWASFLLKEAPAPAEAVAAG